MEVSWSLGAGGGHVIGVGKEQKKGRAVSLFSFKKMLFARLVCSGKVSAISTQVQLRLIRVYKQTST